MKKLLTNNAKLAVLYYLRFFAKLQLKKINPKIIGITGSVGKTSTRNAVEAVLKNTGIVKISKKANSETGIPLNILGIKIRDYSYIDWIRILVLAPVKLVLNWEKVDTYIVEMGIDSPHPPKNMSYLLTILKPHVGVFLNAQAVHSEPFDHLIEEDQKSDREKKARELIGNEKGKLITSLPENGTSVLNIDDENVSKFISLTKANIITFGYDDRAAVQIENVIPTLKGTWFSFKHHNQMEKFVFPTAALGNAFGYTFAAAISVGISQGLSLDECVQNLKTYYKLPKGRMSLIPGINQSIIIDSSYNASTIPMIDALNTLNAIAPGRKIALLGDMREMGEESELAHQAVAKIAFEKCDKVYIVGPMMRKFAAPILGEKASIFSTTKDAVQLLINEIKPNDTVLIKASQNTLFFEHAVEKLMRSPAEAKKVLCRRGEFWDKKRAEVGLD
ncbi:UDP-N-acetylmuramoyl-tripeptide--D-alanyl-D-alanine ligase [Patescibacteria group bacterium]